MDGFTFTLPIEGNSYSWTLEKAKYAQAQTVKPAAPQVSEAGRLAANQQRHWVVRQLRWFCETARDLSLRVVRSTLRYWTGHLVFEGGSLFNQLLFSLSARGLSVSRARMGMQAISMWLARREESENAPSIAAPQFREVSFRSQEGYKSNGFALINHPDPQTPTVLFLGPNAVCYEEIAEEVMMAFAATKENSKPLCNFVFVNYPGYESFTAIPSEAGCKAIAHTAYDYVTQELKIPKQKVIVAGMSIGGPIAASVIESHPESNLLLLDTLASLEELVGDWCPSWTPQSLRRLLVRLTSWLYQLQTLEAIKKVKGYCAIISSTDDFIMGPSHHQQMVAAQQAALSFAAQHSCGHTGFWWQISKAAKSGNAPEMLKKFLVAVASKV